MNIFEFTNLQSTWGWFNCSNTRVNISQTEKHIYAQASNSNHFCKWPTLSINIMGYLTILVERLHKCNICDFTGENFKNVILDFLSSVRLLANIICHLKDLQFIYILTSIKWIGTSIAPFYSILSLIHPVIHAFIQCFYQFISFSILLNDALTHTYTN